MPVEKDERDAAAARRPAPTRSPPSSAPTARSAVGEDAIRRYLDEHDRRSPRRRDAHRLKAEKARRRYLEEECECLATSYTLSTTTDAPLRRGRRARPRRTEGGRLRRPLRDRRAGDAEREARRRAGAVPDPRRLQPAARPPGARRRARARHRCCPATSSSTSATARRTSPRSTPSACSRSSATTSSSRSPRRCATACGGRRPLTSVAQRAQRVEDHRDVDRLLQQRAPDRRELARRPRAHRDELQRRCRRHALAGDSSERRPIRDRLGDAVDAVDERSRRRRSPRRPSRPPAHRDADVGQGERRRVVDAVADHHDRRSPGRARSARTTSSLSSGVCSA